MTDPHAYETPHENNEASIPGREKEGGKARKGAGGVHHGFPGNHTPPCEHADCGCSGGRDRQDLRSDPHGEPEGYATLCEGRKTNDALLPPGVFRCTEGDYARIRLTVAEILAAEPLDGTDGVMKLAVRLGERTKTICTDLAGRYEPGQLPGKRIVVADNLEPRRFGAELSYGAALTAEGDDGRPILIEVGGEGTAGSGGQVK